jgi:hypothetical protein
MGQMLLESASCAVEKMEKKMVKRKEGRTAKEQTYLQPWQPSERCAGDLDLPAELITYLVDRLNTLGHP